jgi:hypothetical protein
MPRNPNSKGLSLSSRGPSFSNKDHVMERWLLLLVLMGPTAIALGIPFFEVASLGYI